MPVVLPIILLIAAYCSVSHAACLGPLFPVIPQVPLPHQEPIQRATQNYM